MTFTMETPIGKIDITEEEGALVSILLSSSLPPSRPGTEGGKVIEAQLEEYFSQSRTSFSFPLSPEGTPFQKRVWEATMKIPYGERASYKEIAEIIGNKAYRAVGQALGKNPIPIVIPCHRVVGKDGIGGYGGGLEIKRALLSLESN